MYKCFLFTTSMPTLVISCLFDNSHSNGINWYLSAVLFRSCDFLKTESYLGPIFFWEKLTCGSAGKESACNVGDLGLIPGLGRSPGEGKGYPLQYSALENSMDYILNGVSKSWTRLSRFWLSLSSSEGQNTHKVFHTVDWGQGLTREPSFMSANLRLELDFAVIQSLSHVSSWTVAHQAPLSSTISQS